MTAMSLAVIDAPQETDLRDSACRAEENRRRLQDAGFKTCTKNGMMCSLVKEVTCEGNRIVVDCKKWGKVSQVEADRCLMACLMPVVAV